MSMLILNDRFVIDPNTEPRRGGMAEIRKAHDMQDNRDVAIKLFKEEFANDRHSREAFSRESKHLQALDHPHIVGIIDGGTDTESGRRFLVLDWLETCLPDYLESHPLGGWDDFYEKIGRPILGALSHAFARDIVHRDLKPHNILVTSDGVLKVADFGISKFRGSVQPGLTLAGFRSEPYPPPERDDGRYSDTRDVYSFAVLTLECLCEHQILTYDDVYQAIDEVDAPQQIHRILRSALDRDPSGRPINIAVLQDQIEKYQTEREKGWASVPTCCLRISVNAISKLRPDFPGADDAALQRIILDDLNEICGISRYEIPGRKDAADPAGRVQFHLISAQYRYQAVVDQDDGDHLVMVNAFEAPPSSLEVLRDESWQPEVVFRLGPPPMEEDGTRFVAWLINGLIDFEDQQKTIRLAEKRDQLFRTWGQFLHARVAVEQAQERPIPYSGFRIDGSRIHFAVSTTPDDDLIGQPWYVALPDGRTIGGEIDDVHDGYLVLWTERSLDVPIPKRGQLRFDTRASRQSLRRQRAALDAIRFERCVRPFLKSLLVDPSEARVPSAAVPPRLFQDDLDEDKRSALGKALATRDFLFVEGPPGTGKTRLIAEVILQLIHRDPSVRILLTSQTHVALDNALERVKELSTEAKVVRIGRRTDPRVAESVKSVLLETKAEEWLQEVRENSEAFLGRWASEHQIDRSEIDLGIAVSRLRLALVEESSLKQRFADAEAELDAFKKEHAASEARADGTTYQELRERIDQAKEMVEAIRHDRTSAEARTKQAKKHLVEIPDFGKDLSMQPIEELGSWEHHLLDSDDTTRQCRGLIELVEEWRLRFGRSSDFYGALLADCQVVAGTCIGFAGARGMQDIEFDVCIVDEASKATVTELLVPLSRAHSWIVVGDRQQLPPFIDSALQSHELLKEYGIRRDEIQRTLLDHLADNLPDPCQTRLTQQHRMSRPIGDLVSECFYEGALKTVKGEERFDISLAIPTPVTWFSTARLHSRIELTTGQSYKNIAEARQAIRIVERLNWIARASDTRYSVVVLTGYGAQKVELDRAISQVRSDLDRIELSCNTIDAFQGREADVAIYSVTRCNKEGVIGFLGERRRLNVALSRGRIGLAIIGDHVFCRSVKGRNPFEDVLHHIAAHGKDCSMTEVAE